MRTTHCGERVLAADFVPRSVGPELLSQIDLPSKQRAVLLTSVHIAITRIAGGHRPTNRRFEAQPWLVRRPLNLFGLKPIGVRESLPRDLPRVKYPGERLMVREHDVEGDMEGTGVLGPHYGCHFA